ncbi:MAG: transglycosylase domain-containing protein [Patescibacteria group bacterium]|jgi:1A family penicillin-binding protein
MTFRHLANKTRTNQNWRDSKKYYVKGPGGGGRRKKTSILSLLLSRRMFKAYFYLFAGTALFILISIAVLSSGLPDPKRLMTREVAQSTKIYDRTGQTVLYEVYGDEKRTLVNLNDIPDYVKNATIAVEDKDFYKHGGFSLWAIFRTAVTDVLFGKKAGGSTLTQQFIKNAVLTNEKTVTRKLKELILAYRAEKKFTKNEILQMYFNEIPYGSTAYGVEAASQKYFGKPVKNATLGEAAILAALPQAPSFYSPYGPNLDRLFDRQKYILGLMAEQGYISKDQAETAKNEKIVFKEQDNNILAPHFVMYIKALLSDKYGEKMVEQGGLKIYTTLDLYKQKAAEEVIAEKAPANQSKYDAWNASLVSIDPKTGQVLAMVGSKDFFGESQPANCVSGKSCKFEPNDNVALRLRQPGSSLKPAVYATAFLRGYTPDTILYDVVTNFSTDPSNPYEPHNYNLKEYGPISMRRALAGSLNVPAVKTIYLAGIGNVIDVVNDLGYTTLKDKDRFGLSLVLGGGEVKLLEHTNAYGVFARDGVYHPVSLILKVEDKNGNVLEEYKNQESTVLNPQVARQINSILSDNNARSYIFSPSNYLTLGGRPVAAKTGTTNDYRDAWTLGFTPSIVTGVWVGNNNNSPMKRGADGSVVAAPIWNAYMKRVLGDTPVEYFKAPDPVRTGKPVLDGSAGQVVKIDKYSGLLATENTPPDQVIEKTFQDPHCILYYVNKNDPRGAYPKSPADDPQFSLWEGAVQSWAKRTGVVATSTPPTEKDNIHLPENKPALFITNLEDGQTITSSLLDISINAQAPRGIAKAEYYFDGSLAFTNTQFPFNFNQEIDFLSNGFHKLKVRVCDDANNCAESELNLNINLSNQTQKFSLKWIEPANGAVLSVNDFPINLALKSDDYKDIKKVNFYFAKADGSSPTLIGSVTSPQNSIINASWAQPPTTGSGDYKVYAIIHSKNGAVKKSDERNVFIK